MKTLTLVFTASLLFAQGALHAEEQPAETRTTRPCTEAERATNESSNSDSSNSDRPCAVYLPGSEAQVAQPYAAAANSSGAMKGVAIGIAVVATAAIASTIGGGGHNSANTGTTGTTGSTGTTGTVAAH